MAEKNASEASVRQQRHHVAHGILEAAEFENGGNDTKKRGPLAEQYHGKTIGPLDFLTLIRRKMDKEKKRKLDEKSNKGNVEPSV